MKNTIKTQLGDDWLKLSPAIQRRFNKLPSKNQPIIYHGVMHKVWCSKAGCLFAWLTRIIGNPLTASEGINVPMVVKLTQASGSNGINWQRTYQFDNRKPEKVSSIKKQHKRKMMECVGAGFGMYLDVSVENKALHFRSSRYFCKIFGFYVPLLHLLTPGKTHVIHEDLGDGQFSFSLSMKHPLLGQTFYQIGVFHE